MKQNRNTESGNALWFVMLGIVLLAALTIAVTRGSDSVEQSGDFERYRVQATDVMRYTKGIEQAVETMRARGISENDISFHTDEWGHTDYEHTPAQPNSHHIFHPEGTGISFRTLPAASNWEIFGSHKVQDLETSANDLIIQAEVSRNVCIQINMLMDITNPVGEPPSDDGEPPSDDIDAVDPYVGSFANGAGVDLTIGDDAAELAGEQVGCREDAGSFYYYHALIPR